ncbi:MAG: hypothetical protein K0S61_86 [Anaerocolumna sp.]|jgi:prefoldin subunit 5|nr:hypothetical protein [Anaerocolumna sp.]
MNKSTIKAVSNIIVSVGVGAIVKNAIKYTTPGPLKLATKVCMGIGGFVLTSMISEAATKYTESKIDEVVEDVQNIRNIIENVKYEVE